MASKRGGRQWRPAGEEEGARGRRQGRKKERGGDTCEGRGGDGARELETRLETVTSRTGGQRLGKGEGCYRVNMIRE